MLDLVLASVHHLLAFALVAILTAELIMIRQELEPARVARLARIDSFYGGVAMALLAAGFLRVFFGLKGSAFYLGNPVFWTKIAAFIAVGLLSALPTIRIIRWARAAAADGDFRPPSDEVQNARRYMHLEALVFISIPILAAALARGYGV